MRKAPCADLAALRSAFVDSSISAAGREKLLVHLVDCLPCRRDVEDQRQIRQLLRSSADATPAPIGLPGRLVDIAGADAQRPLHTRSFHRPRPTTGWKLPSQRRARRVRAAAGTLTAGVLVAAAALIGYGAAPASTLATVGDPTQEAQAAFTSTLGQFPLAGDALGAVMLADTADLSSVVGGRLGQGPTAGAGSALSDAKARAAMQRAADVVGTLNYSGLQSFLALRNGRVMTADLEVEARAGQGVQVQVVSPTGQRLVKGFVPNAVSSRVVDSDLLTLLERNYDLVGAGGWVVAGRPATMVAAYRGGAVQARWWLDDQTGVLLWQQSYDEHGAADLSFGFTSVAVSRKARIIEHLPPRLAVPVTDFSLTLANADQLRAAGWFCQPDLAGLSLVRVRSDRVVDPTTLHLVYSDGVSTVSVFEQRGRLDEVPSDSQWDGTTGAYLHHGPSSLATWQSRDRVFSVITDGSPELLARVVSALPHQAPDRPSTMERIKAGWAEILAEVRG